MVRHTTQRAKKKFFCFRERGGHGGLVPFVPPFFVHEAIIKKTFTIMTKKKQEELVENDEMQDFSIEVKRTIVDIINDSPSLVSLGDKEYVVKGMRYYSLYRICKLVMDMKEADQSLDTDQKVITALCTDLDAMCEIMAIVLCNHRFVPDGINSYEDANDVMSRNDKMVAMMKAKVMNSTFDTNQWAAIILGAIKSIDLSGFFLLKKSVSVLTDSLMERKTKSVETASQFMEAQSLVMQAIS